MRPIIVAAAAALALIGVYLALGGASYAPARVADPCAAREWRNSQGLQQTAEQIVLSALDGAACKLHVTREDMVLAFSSRASLAQFARQHNVSTQQLDELVRVLSIRPAHFASNLGVVELCLALHLTFDFRRDRLIWDTGHQIYPHKLITGRYPQFGSIRTRGGLMGYPNPHESEFDLFMTGHAGCSVSTVLGLKAGDDLLGETDRRAVDCEPPGCPCRGRIEPAPYRPLRDCSPLHPHPVRPRRPSPRRALPPLLG